MENQAPAPTQLPAHMRAANQPYMNNKSVGAGAQNSGCGLQRPYEALRGVVKAIPAEKHVETCRAAGAKCTDLKVRR